MRRIKRYLSRIFTGIAEILKEAKKIRWCGLKRWLKSGTAVIAVGTAIAGFLALSDIIASYIITLMGGLPL